MRSLASSRIPDGLKESYIVCVSELTVKLIIRLAYFSTIVLDQCSESIDLVTQMLCQRPGEGSNEAPDLLSIVLFRRALLDMLVKSAEPWCESRVLLEILLHQTGPIRQLFNSGKKHFLFDVVVMLHRFAPALTVCEEVSDALRVALRYLCCLNVHRVEAANDAVVSHGHLCCGVVGSM